MEQHRLEVASEIYAESDFSSTIAENGCKYVRVRSVLLLLGGAPMHQITIDAIVRRLTISIAQFQ